MFDFTYGSSSNLQPAHTYGRIRGQAVTQGVAYPSPFFDLAHTYLPPTVKQMFKWCRYYYLTQPLIAAVVNKMAEYPITDLVIDTDNKGLKDTWERFFESDIQLRPRLLDIGLYYFCFHGDTKVVTDQGVFKIRDMVDKTYNVLSAGGVYRPAHFRSYGKQELLEVEFRDGRTVLATPEHEWPVVTSSGKIIKLPTTEIEGRSIPRNVAPRPDQNEDFFEGIRHGFVFGDGTLYNNGAKSRAQFCGSKDLAMVKYFEGFGSEPKEYKDQNLVMIHGLPSYYKLLPANEQSASYWYGFVCGLLAADGSVDTHGCVVLTQASRTVLEVIEEQLPRIGMVAGPLRGYWRSSDYGEGDMFYLTLLKQSILPQDLLLPHHRQKFEENFKPTSYGKSVGVRSVRRTGLVDEVFCCNEEETHTFTVENGVLTGNCYGNALGSMMHPFVKWLKCKYCGHTLMAKKAKYRFRSYDFHMTCDKCGQTGVAGVEDQYLQTSGGTKIILWNPEDIDIVFNPITQDTEYFYSLPIQTLNDMAVGRREIIEQLPQVFIDAAKRRKSITLNKDNLFHLKRPSVLSGPRDTGWGIPIVLPVLKDVFYLQIMKKAQEAILLERIVPLTVIFPQQSSGTADPYCVSHNTLIETRDGLKPSVEVTDRDFVKTHSGAWRRVERAVDRKVRNGEKVFKITAASLSAFPFEVSEDHPILSVRKADSCRDHMPGEPSWIKAKDLSEGDFVCYPIKRSEWRGEFSLDLADFNPERAATPDWIYRRLSRGAAEIYEFFEENGVPEFSRKGLPKNDQPLNRFCEEHGWARDDYEVARAIFSQELGVDRMPRFLPVTKELSFLVGLYAAEGSRKDTLASLALNADEEESVDRIDAYLQSFGCSPVSRSVRGNSLDVDINDVLISSVLFSCGWEAANKHLPRFITEAPNPIALEAVNGVICGDGYDFIASSGRGKKQLRRIGLKTISPQLAMDVRTILLSAGVLATVQRATPKPDEIAKTDYYQVNTNGAAAERLADLLGWPYRKSPSGRSSGFFRDGYVYLKVKKIENAPDVKVVRGFQVDGDKSFCVAGVATHNTSVNLVDWKEHIAQEIQRWRLDRNYIPILPLPIGNQVIGGDGRALLMAQEIKIWSDQIIAGMGVPNEFIYGGLQWSGSNVSLRMLENQFMRYLSGLLLFIRDFLIKSMAAHMGWPSVGVRFKPFKMADDLQRKAFLFQLNQAGKVSDTTLITDSDLNADEENELLKKETKARLEAVKEQQLAEAEIAGEAAVINAKYQAKAQTIMMQEQQQAMTGTQGTAPGEPGEEVGAVPIQPPPEGPPQPQEGSQTNPLQQIVQRLRSLSPDSQRVVLTRIEQQNPELANQLRSMFNSGGGVDASPNLAGAPLPNQLPPRRGAESAMI